jgi:secreted PhoX family phosphatase
VAAVPSFASHATSMFIYDFNNFFPLSLTNKEDPLLHLASGFESEIIIKDGDFLWQEHQDQDQDIKEYFQFGTNNDFIAFLPLTMTGYNQAGLLCVNHEFSLPHLRYPAHERQDEKRLAHRELASLGHSVLVIGFMDKQNQWQIIDNHPCQRRITASSTICSITGPAAGNKRLQTIQDPSGTKVIGTIANCSGGVTPWHTVLIAEENIDFFFSGTLEKGHYESDNYQRLSIGGKNGQARYASFDQRFDLGQTPNEANRFGWIVEYDPYQPNGPVYKRTALGRFKHESATVILSHNGQVVVYSADDEADEFLYKFVSHHVYDKENPKNHPYLDEGTLYVAQFHEDGTVDWLPLCWMHGLLTEQQGFYNQADVLIETRRAAHLLGATPMDRPEGIAIHPTLGHVFVSMTKNKNRTLKNAANPRAPNPHGHILALMVPEHAHHLTRHSWKILLLGGEEHELSCPDNLAFHPIYQELWIATDGLDEAQGRNDGLFRMSTNHDGTLRSSCLLSAPAGAEVTGPCFTPDGKHLFVSIQHPGDIKNSSYENPATSWPAIQSSHLPPRSAVIAIRPKKPGP